MSRSKCQKLLITSGVIVTDIPIKPQRDTHRHTDRQTPPKTIPARRIAGAQVIRLCIRTLKLHLNFIDIQYDLERNNLIGVILSLCYRYNRPALLEHNDVSTLGRYTYSKMTHGRYFVGESIRYRWRKRSFVDLLIFLTRPWTTEEAKWCRVTWTLAPSGESCRMFCFPLNCRPTALSSLTHGRSRQLATSGSHADFSSFPLNKSIACRWKSAAFCQTIKLTYFI